MPIGSGKHAIAFLSIYFAVRLCFAEHMDQKRPWKGHAILGNGHLTAVYSDDSRITTATHEQGIQHFYFNDYTADYVAFTSFDVYDGDKKLLAPIARPEIGMKNFFTAQTRTLLSNSSTKMVLCFVHPEDAVVLSLAVAGMNSGSYRFEARLRAEIKTDQTITLTSLKRIGNAAVATWSNGTELAIAPDVSGAEMNISGSSVTISGKLGQQAKVLLIPAKSEGEALTKTHLFEQKPDIERETGEYWESWMNSGRLPVFPHQESSSANYLEAYKRNLYCVKSANLNGQIPADITGEFVTSNMPQLYPRDAMMCARALLATGHAEEARQVIEFWANHRVPMKTPGEFYARYDAHAKAVDAGSGARFDEPEWDANGYYIYLLDEYHRRTSRWLADKQFFYELADFLVHHISSNGLLFEGGIVEWTGYLPSTNMTCAAALRTAARMAKELGDPERAKIYAAASDKISSSLLQMFDGTRQTYADLRFTGRKGEQGKSLNEQSGDKTYLWDTTANVGLIWGYPDHREVELSNKFYAQNTVKLGGGMQYFDSPDPGLAAYGHDVFFFTTAAAAEYESLHGSKDTSQGFIDWMMRNANSYGLMPERIHLDESDCSPASPLSWCSAEFAAALLLWSQK